MINISVNEGQVAMKKCFVELHSFSQQFYPEYQWIMILQ